MVFIYGAFPALGESESEMRAPALCKTPGPEGNLVLGLGLMRRKAVQRVHARLSGTLRILDSDPSEVREMSLFSELGSGRLLRIEYWQGVRTLG